MHTFIIAAETAATHYLVITLLGALSLLIMKLFANNKKDVEYASLVLTFVKGTLGDKLGPKANAVFSVWEDGLQAIQDGKFDGQDMADEFAKFIKAAVLAEHQVSLTSVELSAVRQAADTTIQLNSVKASSTNRAVKAMMVEPSVRALTVRAMGERLRPKP